MSEPEPTQLHYASPAQRREPLSLPLEQFAFGGPAAWLPVGGAILALASSLTLAPRIPMERALLVGPVLLASVMIWVLVVALRGWLTIVRRGDTRASTTSRLAIWCFPALLALGILALQTLLLPRIAAWLSTSAAERIAQPPTTPTTSPAVVTRRVGLFRATDVERIPGGVTFTVGNHGLFDVYGYCYTTAGNPRPPGAWRGPVKFHELGHGWWLWEWQD